MCGLDLDLGSLTADCRDAKCLAIAITHICHGLNIPTLQGWDLRSVLWSFVYFMYYTVKTLQFSDNNYVLRRKLCLHAKNLTLSRARLVITRTDGSTSPCCWPVRWQTKIDFCWPHVPHLVESLQWKEVWYTRELWGMFFSGFGGILFIVWHVLSLLIIVSSNYTY